MSKITVVAVLIGATLATTAPLFGQTAPSGFSSSGYTPPAQDVSAELMTGLFGPVAQGFTSASGATPQNILGAMFYALNTAMLLVAGLLITGTAVTGILDTAHHGEWLGGMQRGISTFWSPLRGALALGGLAPIAGGYSAVQALILWLAMLGVGVANTVWAQAIQFLESGGGITYAVDPPSDKLTQLADTLLMDLTCEYAANGPYAQDSGLGQQIAENTPSAAGVQIIGFDGASGSGVSNAACGQAQAEVDLTDAPAALSGYADPTVVRQALFDAQRQGLQDMIAALRPAAQSLAGGISGGVVVFSQPPANAVQQSVYAYENDLQAALRHLSTDVNGVGGLASAAPQGWGGAGAYYWDFAKMGNAVENGVDNVASAQGCDLTRFNVPSEQTDLIAQAIDRSRLYAQSQGLWASSWNPSSGAPAPSSGGLVASLQSAWSNTIGAITAPLTTLSNLTGAVNFGLTNWAAGNLSQGDPVQNLQSLGGKMMVAGETIFLVGQTAGGAGSAAASAGGAASFFTGGVSGLIGGLAKALGGVGVGLAYLLAVPMIFAGAMLAIYLPATPFILWTAGVFSWLLVLAEALIAAPLWMVAHASPKGEGWAGERGQMGWELVVALIARPVMMVFGLVAGMAVLRIIAAFFGTFFAGYMQAALANTLQGFVTIVVCLMVLAGTMVWIAHKSFSLIWAIPDQVLKWFSRGHGELGDSGAEGHIHGTVIAGWMGRTEGAASGVSRAAAPGISSEMLGGSDASKSRKETAISTNTRNDAEFDKHYMDSPLDAGSKRQNNGG